jgi:hypothetical protein
MDRPTNEGHGLYGLLAEFETAEGLLSAARQTRLAGYRHVDAFSPYSVHGIADELGFTRTRLPAVVLVGGIVGAALGYGMQYYLSAIEYPLNVGGRPMHSWPSFVPVTFELTVLVAALSAVLGMLALNGLPRPHHPLFAVPQFARATQDRFFLCIEAGDPLFEPGETRRFLASLNPEEVLDVPL